MSRRTWYSIKIFMTLNGGIKYTDVSAILPSPGWHEEITSSLFVVVCHFENVLNVMTASQHQYTTKKQIATLTSTSNRCIPSSVKRLYQHANFYDCVKSAARTTISKNQRPQWSLSSSRVVILSNLCGRVDVRQLLHQELTYWLERTQTRPRLTVRVPMVTAYHPKNTPVSNILSRNHNILADDDSTKLIFSQPLLKPYRRAKNLRDL